MHNQGTLSNTTKVLCSLQSGTVVFVQLGAVPSTGSTIVFYSRGAVSSTVRVLFFGVVIVYKVCRFFTARVLLGNQDITVRHWQVDPSAVTTVSVRAVEC